MSHMVRVRLKTDLVRVDGAALHAGTIYHLNRQVIVSTEHGRRTRYFLTDDDGRVVTQVKPEHVEILPGK